MLKDKIIEIFVKVDDFCKEFQSEITKHQLQIGTSKVRDCKSSLSESVNHHSFNHFSCRSFH